MKQMLHHSLNITESHYLGQNFMQYVLLQKTIFTSNAYTYMVKLHFTTFYKY